MKMPLRTAVVAACWLALASASNAQTGTPDYDPLGEFDQLPQQVRVQVEFIEVSHETFTELMFGPRASANDSDLRAKLADLIKQQKASIMETMMCIAKSAERGKTQSIEEFIYATEYEPPNCPTTVDPGAAKDAPARPVPELATGPSPSAWDTRYVGSTLEVEPFIFEGGRIVNLRILPELVYHVGNEVWTEWQDVHGSAPVQMPTFYTVRLDCSLTVVPGQPALAGALSPKDDKGHPDPSRKLMLFVKADVLTVGR